MSDTATIAIFGHNHLGLAYVVRYRDKYFTPGNAGGLRPISNCRFNYEVTSGLSLELGRSVKPLEFVRQRFELGINIRVFVSIENYCRPTDDEITKSVRSICLALKTLTQPTNPQQQQTKQGNIEMNSNEMITILQLEHGAKIVSAKYDDNGSSYSFKNVVGVELEEGDLIVVETRDGYQLVTVVNPDVDPTEIGCAMADLKHVVAKVRNDDYVATKKGEAKAVRKIAMSQVTAQLDTFRKQLGDNAFNAVAGELGFSEQPEDAEVLDSEDH